MEKIYSTMQVRRREISILFSVIAFLIFGYIAGNLKWIQDFQLILDLLAGIFAFFIGTLALVRFYTKKNSINYLLLGLGFLMVGILDVFQILLTLNVYSDLFLSHGSEIFPKTVVLSRVFLALIFFLSWIYTNEEQKEKKLDDKVVLVGILIVFSVFVAILSLFSQIFADFSEYTFAIVIQTIALMVYILTLIGYLRGKGMYYRSFDFWILLSLSFGILSQIFFLPFLNIEYYLMLDLSTLAKFLSYTTLLFGFLYSIYEMYKSEEMAQKELIRKNLILSETKKKVEEAYMILRNEKWALTKQSGSADKILKDILKK